MKNPENFCRYILAVCLLTLLSIRVPVALAQPSQPPPAPSPMPSSAPASTTASTPAPVELSFAVVLDAAHGGTNLGALLEAGQDEKSFTLNLTNALDARLRAQGINVLLTRDGDVDLSGDARAATMNHAQAAACISIHATPSGNGVHLFTSAQPAQSQPAQFQTMPPTAAPPVAAPPAAPLSSASAPALSSPAVQRAFVPWRAAQSAYLTQSLRLESEVSTALAHQQIPTLLGRATLMPLESAACPAIAIEVAPLHANTSIADARYQQQLVDALTAALLAWRADWRMQP